MSEQSDVLEHAANSFLFDKTPVLTVADSHDNSRVKRGDSSEALRLVQQIFFRQGQHSPTVVTFAGIDHSNGCSLISASVAEALAATAQRRVCLVEANFHSPSLPDLFHTTNHFGLTDSLLETSPIDSYARRIGRDNLFLLSAGKLTTHSSYLLSSNRFSERIAELRKDFDFVIIDAPPLIRYSDAVVIGKLSDGLVIVVEADSTRREAAAVAATSLRASGVSILAAVLNKRTYPIPRILYDRI